MSHARALFVIAAAGAAAPSLSAFPVYFGEWQTKYNPSGTTLPARMGTLTGTQCAVCHHPPSFGDDGNCYREDIKTGFVFGLSITEALNQLDRVDSDGDGVPNGVEIRTARAGEPGQVGYNMGLVGATGDDPCYGPNPGQALTGAVETPPGFCYANCDGSTIIPSLNALDFACFLNDYRAAQSLIEPFQAKHYANCDGSTIVPALNALDFACFLDKFRNGCP